LESLVKDHIDSANVYFLLWSPGNKDNETPYKEAEALHEWTKSNGENSQFTIDERRFIWSVVWVKVKSGV
jgi:hypothetical protein